MLKYDPDEIRDIEPMVLIIQQMECKKHEIFACKR